jgi:cystathionine beta-lyase
MGSAATADPAIGRKLADGINHLGWAVSGEEAYLMLRGLRTLPVRLAQHDVSARQLAQWLQARPEVGQVLHPALPGAPDHTLWARDYSGAAGLFAVVLKKRPKKAVHALLDALRLFGLGFSWGGFESLALDCDHQFAVRKFRPKFAGPVLRLNVGLEDPGDLIEDLKVGLAALG